MLFVILPGERFRPALGLPDRMSAVEVGDYLLRKFVFVHLTDNRQKFDLLMCASPPPPLPERGCLGSAYPHPAAS